MTAREEPANVVRTQPATAGEGGRVAEAQTDAERRLRNQRELLRPLGP